MAWIKLLDWQSIRNRFPKAFQRCFKEQSYKEALRDLAERMGKEAEKLRVLSETVQEDSKGQHVLVDPLFVLLVQSSILFELLCQHQPRLVGDAAMVTCLHELEKRNDV